MSLDNRPVYSGGCQCGAVRFHLEGALGDASVCHCRMCQKASGGFYQPLVTVGEAKLTWTRGAPKKFRSSNFAFRGFCGECGTPLTYEGPDGMALSIAAFDDPAAITPSVQWGVEAKLPYVDQIPTLPARHTLEDLGAQSFVHDVISFQHPDYDTETWPPERREGRKKQ